MVEKPVDIRCYHIVFNAAYQYIFVLMNRFTDLRFVIGLFIGIVGLILLAASFIAAPRNSWDNQMNLYSGIFILIVSLGMLLAAFRQKQVE